MARNPSPQVAAARDFGKAHNCKQVIIFFVQEDGRVGYASYGKNRALCDNARDIAENVWDAFERAVELIGE